MDYEVIISFSPKVLLVDDAFLFHKEHLALISTFQVADLKIADLVPQYIAEFETLDDAVKKIIKNRNNAIVHEKDRQRDALIRHIIAHVKNMCGHPSPNKREAALRLQVLFDTYGEIAKKGIAAETSRIYNLIQDLKSEKYAADTNTVGLNEWLPSLVGLNNQIIDLRAQIAADSANNAAIETATAACHAIDITYHKIRDRVNSYLPAAEGSPLSQYVAKLNAILKKYQAIARRHKTMLAKGKHHGGGEDEDIGENGNEETDV